MATTDTPTAARATPRLCALAADPSQARLLEHPQAPEGLLATVLGCCLESLADQAGIAGQAG